MYLFDTDVLSYHVSPLPVKSSTKRRRIVRRPAEPTPGAAAPSTGDALSRWDTNGNGRITCGEAREHGIAPVHREHPAYRFMRDGDGDGVVCE